MPAETEWQRRTRRETARAVYVAEFGNFCELCGNEPKLRGLSEDHDHKTGAHRGWLCYRCNRALPAYVTIEWLRKAVAYLERAGSASAAADDGRCPGCGWYVADCNCIARAAADEPGETPA